MSSRYPQASPTPQAAVTPTYRQPGPRQSSTARPPNRYPKPVLTTQVAPATPVQLAVTGPGVEGVLLVGALLLSVGALLRRRTLRSP